MCMMPSTLPTKIPLKMKNFLKDSNASCTLRNYFICQAKFHPYLQEVFTPSVILMRFFSVFILKSGRKEHFCSNLLAPEHLIKRPSQLSKKKSMSFGKHPGTLRKSQRKYPAVDLCLLKLQGQTSLPCLFLVFSAFNFSLLQNRELSCGMWYTFYRYHTENMHI